MRRLQVALAIVVVLVAGAAAPVRAAEPLSPLVRVELLSEMAAVRPGETFWIALRQEITPGWHTYWGVNPGDAGEPTRVEWTLPAGVTAGEIAWPYPSRFPVGIAMSYGYEHGVVLPIPMTVSDAAALARRGR
jgi:thiol:disulfide interchange protein DsbD